MGCEWDVWMPGGCEGFTLNSGSLRWVQPSYHPTTLLLSVVPSYIVGPRLLTHA
ncbi:hypothetical protein CORC01_03634 [Colletotrichum orchidophilum]|uniref:Uncharacterized protein n=1 Tax=Colletotrichum orchidophilum TaxID=1209926 RepID=A0A1G4BIF8_9PEZI|nr:uncharacterized protein CORC01_03634 [Colletotrichum orchidophilum]OHF01067.1 hypothetical protein CORC01_03634 [Colletotrichum orchidophilum]